jgi:ligand-binding sensor domain-containing protein
MENFRMKFYTLTLITFLLAFSLVSCNKEVSTSPPDQVPENSGKLFVDSKPSGAKIYLNNKNTGFLTPDTVPYLDGGNYKLTTKLTLYKDSSEIVKIKKDSLTSVFFDYTVNPTMKGGLYVDSYPQGASITVNDTITGRVTPFEFRNVLPDTYTVVLTKTGYWNSRFTGVVKTDRTFRIYGSLEDTSIFVNYRMSNSGIPSDYFNGVAVDQDGNVWIVNSYSLTRFDWNNWFTYTPDNSTYPGGNINSIYAFGNDVWVCSSNGLIIYKNGTFEIQGTATGLPSDYIYCALKESENSIWVGTNLGLCHFDGSTWTVYNTQNSGLPINNVSAVKRDANDVLWIGTVGAGMVEFDGNNWVVYNSDNADLPSSNRVTSLAIVGGSTVWAGFSNLGNSTQGGTAIFDGQHWTTYVSIPSDYIYGITVQSDNLLWVCNSDNGLSKYENGNWSRYTTSNSRISSNRIFGVAIDQNGHKWIATYGGGLSKYKGN